MPEVKSLAEPMLRRMGWNDAGQLGLGGPATRILNHISRNGDRYALDLVDELKLDWQTVDSALDELEGFGLLLHQITPTGRGLYFAPAQQRYHIDWVQTKNQTWRQRLLRRRRR